MSDRPPSSFREVFQRDPLVSASAPGRVNLIGEHTDYSGGFVLPTVIPQRTVVELAPRADATARLVSASLAAESAAGAYEVGREARRGGFVDYAQGVTKALRERGHVVGGYDAFVRSDVPLGSGLSSSASLEVALARALRAAYRLAIDDLAIALVGQRAENDLVGAPVGVMDPMASSLASEGAALFVDTRALTWDVVPIPAEVELVVIDSGVPHRHATGEYRARREQCERAAASLGVPSLRDVGEADLDRALALPDPLGRRARHVVTENARVLAAVDAMRAGDVATLGRLFAASHASMRDDFEVSTPDVDALVAIAAADPDVAGARMTGGGFGGSVVVLALRGRGAHVARRVARAYAAATGRTPTVLVPPPTAPSADRAA
jgi:galactokinase